VQAHALGEVGILGTVLLRAYTGTFFPIFIEIGSYFTDKEQKISWHSFFETRCTYTSATVNELTTCHTVQTIYRRVQKKESAVF